MKIRNGFVSNSSSSSFIVAVDKNRKLDKVRIVVDVGLDKIKETVLETEGDLICYCEDIFGCLVSELKDDELDQYEYFLNKINNGKKLIVCCVSSDEGGIEEMIYSNFDMCKFIGGENLGEI